MVAHTEKYVDAEEIDIDDIDKEIAAAIGSTDSNALGTPPTGSLYQSNNHDSNSRREPSATKTTSLSSEKYTETRIPSSGGDQLAGQGGKHSSNIGYGANPEHELVKESLASNKNTKSSKESNGSQQHCDLSTDSSASSTRSQLPGLGFISTDGISSSTPTTKSHLPGLDLPDVDESTCESQDQSKSALRSPFPGLFVLNNNTPVKSMSSMKKSRNTSATGRARSAGVPTKRTYEVYQSDDAITSSTNPMSNENHIMPERFTANESVSADAVDDDDLFADIYDDIGTRENSPKAPVTDTYDPFEHDGELGLE